MTFVDRNPARGCGTKQHDAYYMEGDVGAGGALWAWTWFLGDGLDNYIWISPKDVPVRGTVVANPAACIIEQVFIKGEVPYEADLILKDYYRDMLTRTRHIGSADHVGSKYYSAWEFALETREYGPSRRITKKMAKVFAELFMKYGPFPMLFAHKLPVFNSQSQRDHVLEAVQACTTETINWQGKWFDACWEYGEWGQYAREGQDNGYRHFMVPVLQAIGEWERSMSLVPDGYVDEHWARAKEQFKKLRYIEQVFGASWMTGITYTLPKEGDKDRAAEKAQEAIPGIEILDIDEHEKEKKAWQHSAPEKVSNA